MKALTAILCVVLSALTVRGQTPFWQAYATDSNGDGFSYRQQPDSIYTAYVSNQSPPYQYSEPPPSAFTVWLTLASQMQVSSPKNTYFINTNALYIDPPVIDWVNGSPWGPGTVTITVHNADPGLPTDIMAYPALVGDGYRLTVNDIAMELPPGQTQAVFQATLDFHISLNGATFTTNPCILYQTNTFFFRASQPYATPINSAPMNTITELSLQNYDAFPAFSLGFGLGLTMWGFGWILRLITDKGNLS